MSRTTTCKISLYAGTKLVYQCLVDSQALCSIQCLLDEDKPITLYQGLRGGKESIALPSQNITHVATERKNEFMVLGRKINLKEKENE